MNTYDIFSISKLLSANSYPGRGIIIGKSLDGTRSVAAYFIMGRSENSRRRFFAEKDDGIVICPLQASETVNPELIIYSPIKVYKNYLIVTNGDQTDTILDFMMRGDTFENALKTRSFEPDAPNFTPRISGILIYGDCGFTYKMNILKSADRNGSACDSHTFSYTPVDGTGHFIHTYDRNGNPLPSFTGEPKRITVINDIDEFTESIWSSLDEKNKVSLYVRYTDLSGCKYESRMINKYR